MKPLVPTYNLYRYLVFFYIVDLRSGQARDLTITSQWEIFKSFPFSGYVSVRRNSFRILDLS